MKIKEGFILQQMGNSYVAIALGSAGESFSGMIRLNGAGEFLWRELEKGISESELVDKMLARYEGLDRETAEKDLKEFLNKIAVAIEN